MSAAEAPDKYHAVKQQWFAEVQRRCAAVRVRGPLVQREGAKDSDDDR